MVSFLVFSSADFFWRAFFFYFRKMQRKAQDVNKSKHCQKVKKMMERSSDEQEVMSCPLPNKIDCKSIWQQKSVGSAIPQSDICLLNRPCDITGGNPQPFVRGRYRLAGRMERAFEPGFPSDLSLLPSSFFSVPSNQRQLHGTSKAIEVVKKIYAALKLNAV